MMHIFRPSSAPWHRRNRPFGLLASLVSSLATLAVLTALAPSSLSAEPLTLRINDMQGRAGQRVAVVLRTYASRGVGQGQLCFRAFSNGNPFNDAKVGAQGPFASLQEVYVWSSEGDAENTSSFDPLTQEAIIDFSSLSGTVNLEDGAMAAMVFELRSDLVAGSEFEIVLDAENTFLVDAEGLDVPLEIRSGDLEVLASGSPYNLSAEGDETPAGSIAQAGVGTQEVFPISSGQFVFEYDPAFVEGLPVVFTDNRHGSASYSVDLSQPGSVRVTFQSADDSLNRISGDFVRLDLRLRPDLALGATSVVQLDPEDTWLQGPGGFYSLVFENDVIEVIAPTPLFADGFESANLDEWSRAVP